MAKTVKVRRFARSLAEGLEKPRVSSQRMIDPFRLRGDVAPIPESELNAANRGVERIIQTETESYVSEAEDLLRKLPLDSLAQVVARLEEARCRGQVVFTCGNGGSAATAVHLACDLAKGAIAPGKRGIKTLCLCGNISLITAWANDASYDDVFARQMAPWIRPGDVLVAISCSGNSKNVLNAVFRAREAGAATIGLTGANGEALRSLVDICITVPSADVEKIEDVHHTICHLITSCLRKMSVDL